jgi:superfamily I DNA and/or RNA helicase
MFERLIKNGASYVTLSTQHRMRTDIANLVRPMYPRLVDAPNVLLHPSVKGVSTNLFFLSHEAPEQGAGVESMSRCNPYEAHMSIQLAGYLLRNGYGPGRVVLLTTYLGQQQLLRELLRAEVSRRPQLQGLRVATVDGYQGEEADVVILSLVRSTAPIGFIRTANRACVALSRARHGMYILGNARLLGESGELWGGILAHLNREGRVGDSLLRIAKSACQEISSTCAMEDATVCVVHACNVDTLAHNSATPMTLNTLNSSV